MDSLRSEAGRPGDSAMSRPKLDAFVTWLSRALMHVFFRRVDVTGVERIPTDGPVLLVANHHNSQ